MRLVLRERGVQERPASVESLDIPDASSPETEPLPSTVQFGWWLALICAVAFILRLVIIYQGRHDWLSGDGFQSALKPISMLAESGSSLSFQLPSRQTLSIRPPGRFYSLFGPG